MKKTISIILCLVMALSVISTICVPAFAADTYADAKDGDILAELKFGQTTGNYQSKFLYTNAADGEAAATVAVSDEGKTVKIDYNPSAASQYLYGGPIEGLTIGEGKKYTITFKASFKDPANASNPNAGMIANFPNDSDPASVKANGYKLFVGYYGTPSVQHKISAGHGSNMKGKYLNNCKDYAKVNLQTPDANGFFDMAYEIDGEVFRIFINGMFIEEGVYNQAHFEKANKLGFTVYLYNKASQATVKDVKIYKGNTVSATAQYPDYYKNPVNQLVKEYSDAKFGDLLYAPDFTATQGVWMLTDSSGSTKDVFNVTATKDTITFENKDGKTEKGKHLGSAINGLTITDKTEYTFTFKVNNFDNGNVGVGFAASNVLGASSFHYNVYGDFNYLNPSAVTQRGGSKLSSSERATTSYTSIPTKVDADHYTSIKIEMDGYKATVYYLAADDTWAKFDSFDMTNVDYVSGENTLNSNAYEGLSVACTFYVHNKNVGATIKEVGVYKGLLVSEDSLKYEEETTTPPAGETTTPPAGETTNPPAGGTTTPDPVPTGDSAVAIVLALIAVSCGAVLTMKKAR